MTNSSKKSQFDAKLLRPKNPGSDAKWAFIVLPSAASAKLPRRGRTSVKGKINSEAFSVLLEPDGQKSHWLKVEESLLKEVGVAWGMKPHL